MNPSDEAKIRQIISAHPRQPIMFSLNDGQSARINPDGTVTIDGQDITLDPPRPAGVKPARSSQPEESDSHEDMGARIRQLEQRNGELEAALASALSIRRSDTDAQIQTLTRRCDEAHTTLAHERDQWHEQETTFQALIADLTSQVETLTSERASTESELRRVRTAYEQKETDDATTTQLKAELAQLREALTAEKTERAHLAHDLDIAQSETEKTRALLASVDQEKQALTLSLKEEQARIFDLENTITRLNADIVAKTAEIATLDEHAGELLQQNEQSEQQIATLRSENAQFAGELSQAKHDLRQALSAAEQTNVEAERARFALEAQLKDSTDERDQLAKKIDDLTHQLDARPSRADLEELHANISEHEAEIARLRTQRDTLTERVETLSQNVESRKRECDALMRQRDALKSQLKAQDAQTQTLPAHHTPEAFTPKSAPASDDDQEGDRRPRQLARRILIVVFALLFLAGATCAGIYMATTSSGKDKPNSGQSVQPHSAQSAQSAGLSSQETQEWQTEITRAHSLISESETLLADTEGKVSDEATRQTLRLAIDVLSQLASQPAPETSASYAQALDKLKNATEALNTAKQAVLDSNASYQQTAPPTEPTQTEPTPTPSEPSTPQPAPTPASPAQGADVGGYIADMNTSVSSSSGTVSFSVTVSSVGSAPVTVTANVGGNVVTLGQGTVSGARTFSGSISVPTGTYSWSTSADGLINSGSITVN
ncbi:MAG: hypothetical protein ACYCFF_00660 [Schaalia turicensis]